MRITPLAYATYAGTIPKGQYGAGRVAIRDHGTYDDLSPAGSVTRTRTADRLEFDLRGEKLKRAIRADPHEARGQGKPQCPLIKLKDEHAVVAPAAPAT